MKRVLTATVLAGAVVAGGTTPALASPADGRTKALLQEIEEYEEDQRIPDWQRIPDCCVVDPPWGYADAILAITFTVGLVMLW